MNRHDIAAAALIEVRMFVNACESELADADGSVPDELLEDLRPLIAAVRSRALWR